MSKKRWYLSIDLKSFFASVECADRGLDPLATNLVVADETKTEKTICLAVSPSLKTYGLGGRCRLFEVVAATAAENERRLRAHGGESLAEESFDANALALDKSLKAGYIVAPPRMARYMEVSAQIYSVYLRYVSSEDIFAYSIDEVFIDVTTYLDIYKKTPHEIAIMMIKDVLAETGITATCGIGTNMYLAKVAMDIVAKKAPADEDGVRIAELDEISYRKTLWQHEPLTDFWRVGRATAKKLEKNAIHTMGDLARLTTKDQLWLYKTFGVDAEILIDHAWGVEPTTMAHVKSYKPQSKSICEGQVLTSPYTNEMARVIVREMVECIMYQLTDKELATDLLTLDIGYDRENCDNGTYNGVPKVDHYGRLVPPPAHGSARLSAPTNLGSKLTDAILDTFDRITDKSLTVRRVTITAGNLVPEDSQTMQYDFFTDTTKQEKEKSLQQAMLAVRKKYGKNAVLKGTNFEEGATMRERNGQIGGHKA